MTEWKNNPRAPLPTPSASDRPDFTDMELHEDSEDYVRRTDFPGASSFGKVFHGTSDARRSIKTAEDSLNEEFPRKRARRSS